MKLNELIGNLKQIKKDYGNLEVIYAKDSEGNGFQHISFGPSVGNFDDGEFIQEEDLKEYGLKVNVVCVN